jgi:hypothetical protein
LTLPADRRELYARLLRQRGLSAPGSSAIQPRPRPAALPLSHNQEGLWFVDQLHPNQANYSIPASVWLRGRLDAGALRRSLSEIVRRHEALRTVFPVDPDGQPRQVVRPPEPLPLPLTDLSDRPQAEREQEALRLATEEAQRPFDLERGPLVRGSLIRCAEEEHVLLFNVHHIVCDGWSMGVFTRELDALYGAFLEDRPSPLPELPLQCADLALWEREWLAAGELQRRLEYWRSRLANRPALQLPSDRPRGGVQSMRGLHHPLRLSAALSDELRRLARREGVTLYTLLHAAFAVLVAHDSGQQEVVLGAGIANRYRKEMEPLIGYFVTLLPVRSDLGGDPSLRELLARVSEAVLGAASHALPLPLVVRDVAPDRDLARNPLFQVELTLLTPDHNPAVYGYGLAELQETRELPGGLSMTPLTLEGGVARFDMSVFLWDLPSGLTGTIEYCRDLFDAATIAALAERYEGVLHDVLRQPEARIGALRELLRRRDARRQASQATAQAQTARRLLAGARRRAVQAAPDASRKSE